MPTLTLSRFDQTNKNRWVLKIKYKVPPFSHIKIRNPLLPTKIISNKSKLPKIYENVPPYSMNKPDLRIL